MSLVEVVLFCVFLFLEQVYEVRAVKEDLTHLAHLTVEQKLQRAEEKRLMHLKETVQKAHDEKAKVSYVYFPPPPAGSMLM